MTEGFEEIEKLYDRKQHITGVPTGFADLDKILAGMHRGDLLILAARPRSARRRWHSTSR